MFALPLPVLALIVIALIVGVILFVSRSRDGGDGPGSSDPNGGGTRPGSNRH